MYDSCTPIKGGGFGIIYKEHNGEYSLWKTRQEVNVGTKVPKGKTFDMVLNSTAPADVFIVNQLAGEKPVKSTLLLVGHYPNRAAAAFARQFVYV